ncbi:hypothetical protein H4687_004102 [Streptomyces stelliscabiei]|uniref:Uncharacterized protein n=1 Tax=Streptomyces stelliscabiei TaxID=146820 RepID=A0A8I0P214_9ACTN|nr:hypothetical protein [Streptomyces stelliscabiei]
MFDRPRFHALMIAQAPTITLSRRGRPS